MYLTILLFLTIGICRQVSAAFIRKTSFLIIREEMNCNYVSNTSFKPKRFDFFCSN